jgi:hypothetical protein
MSMLLTMAMELWRVTSGSSARPTDTFRSKSATRKADAREQQDLVQPNAPRSHRWRRTAGAQSGFPGARSAAIACVCYSTHALYSIQDGNTPPELFTVMTGGPRPVRDERLDLRHLPEGPTAAGERILVIDHVRPGALLRAESSTYARWIHGGSVFALGSERRETLAT